MHESCFGGGTGAIHIGLQMASCDCNIELEYNTHIRTFGRVHIDKAE